MVKYLKQQDESSCFPIAIINAMKWSEIKVSYKSHFKKIKNECKCDRYGTYTYNTQKVLEKYVGGVGWYTDSDNPLYLIDSHLSKNGAIIIAYDYITKKGIPEGHTTLCIKRTKYYYTLVNNVNTETNNILTKTVSLKSRKNMYKMLSSALEHDLWLI